MYDVQYQQKLVTPHTRDRWRQAAKTKQMKGYKHIEREGIMKEVTKIFNLKLEFALK